MISDFRETGLRRVGNSDPRSPKPLPISNTLSFGPIDNSRQIGLAAKWKRRGEDEPGVYRYSNRKIQSSKSRDKVKELPYPQLPKKNGGEKFYYWPNQSAN